MTKLKYTCFAMPPKGISVSGVYELGKDDEGYFVSKGKFTFRDELFLLKMLFTPIDSEWEEIINGLN